MQRERVMGDIIGIVAVVGGVLIAAVLVWAVMANRRRSGTARRRTEQATHDLYRDMDRQDQASDPDPKRF
jgi:FtsZ-interacting cell division protein ZipA